MRTSPRNLLRQSRDGLDRALHPHRRRAALRDLQALPPSPRILVVCYGNICRSPFAEVALRRYLEAESVSASVASAGFVGPGRPAPATAVLAASLRGFDLTAHTSRSISAAGATNSDVVIVMDAKQRREISRQLGSGIRVILLGDLDPLAIEARAIRDPWGLPLAAFEACYARIDRTALAIAHVLRKRNSAYSARPSIAAGHR